MILSGRRTNDSMGKYIAQKAIQRIIRSGINIVGAKVGIFGITFKPNCPDIRNTKVMDIIQELADYNCEILVTDPFADEEEVKRKFGFDLTNLNEMDQIDFGILAVQHDLFVGLKQKNILNLF